MFRDLMETHHTAIAAGIGDFLSRRLPWWAER
jgi:hypothetical protein